jgi:alpha-mannosidase
VPPLGYRVYRVFDGAAEPGAAVAARETTLENEHLLLELDPATGRIARLVVKASGADVAAPDRPHALAVEDPSDTWSHGVRAYDGPAAELEVVSVELLEAGPVRAIVRVRSRHGASTLREDYVLGADARYVDVRVALDWHGQLELLKLRYPTSTAAERATFEIPYGRLERAADGAEEPGQSWVHVSGDGRGLTVINDAKHGYDVRGGDIGITAVRSPVWAWHDPTELDPEATYEYMDQGLQTFRVRLVPHAGERGRADVVRLAAELNQPPFPLIETYHDGPLPQRNAYLDDGGGAVVLTVVKRAEDDDATVVRAYETTGKPAPARFEVFGRAVEADFGANEIKTFRVPRDREAPVVETNLLEW